MEELKDKIEDTVSPTFERVGEVTNSFGGLTKRELFAAVALNGLVSGGNGAMLDYHVKNSVRYADALIEALGEEEETE